MMHHLLADDVIRFRDGSHGKVLSVSTPPQPTYIKIPPQNVEPLKHYKRYIPSVYKQKKLKGVEMRQEASLVTQNQVTQLTAPTGYALVDAIHAELPNYDKSAIGTIVFNELEKAWWISDQNKRVKHALKQAFKAVAQLPTTLADSVSREDTENEKDNLHTHSELLDSETTP